MILDSGGQGPVAGGVISPERPSGVGRKVVLHLGVIDQPYRTATGRIGAVTTGDVAKWLEDEYGIMAAFYRLHWSTFQEALASSVQVALEAMITGRTVDPWGSGMQIIQSKFREFISSGDAERAGIPRTPTKAALRGVNHRLKHPYRRSNPRRPSFRDTGLYMASMRAWVD